MKKFMKEEIEMLIIRLFFVLFICVWGLNGCAASGASSNKLSLAEKREKAEKSGEKLRAEGKHARVIYDKNGKPLCIDVGDPNAFAKSADRNRKGREEKKTVTATMLAKSINALGGNLKPANVEKSLQQQTPEADGIVAMQMAGAYDAEEQKKSITWLKQAIRIGAPSEQVSKFLSERHVNALTIVNSPGFPGPHCEAIYIIPGPGDIGGIMIHLGANKRVRAVVQNEDCMAVRVKRLPDGRVIFE